MKAYNLALTLLLVAACVLAVHAGSEAAERKRKDDSRLMDILKWHKNDDRPKKDYHPPKYHPKKVYNPPPKKVYYPPPKKVSYQPIIYYCTYFYYDYGHCPSNWYDSMKAACNDYNNMHPGSTYGYSMGDKYNYGYQSSHMSQGGYICFKKESDCYDYWTWFYGHPTYKNMGYAMPNSGYCHTKMVKSYNMPDMQYKY